MRRSSESAIALVMTLIMLSVITVVAVAFLALTQRERISVAQSTQQSDAEIMAEAADERAKVTAYAHYLSANSNLNAVELLVSRNYIRPEGFIPGNTDLTNVNYDFRETGGPLTAGDREQNIANLYYDPRAPVFINTNVPTSPNISNDFRFYLDLNRNGRFETNGLLTELDNAGVRVTNVFVGDPEWIGVLEHPLFPHSRTNRFVGRYAYIVLPIGKSLDINFIHNQAKRLLPVSEVGYYRNQGFGSWELNLAAFLADLNTNVWAVPVGDYYQYDTNLTVQSKGVAFRDALEIYHTRLTSYQNLAPANQLLFGTVDFGDDMIDEYVDGLLDPITGRDNDLATRPWPGSYNWTNFFTPHDFFEIVRPLDLINPLNNFITRLRNTGFANSSYDRYTFYRMLAQLSTDSAPESPRVNVQQLKQKVGAVNPGDFVAEPAGKININYNNLDYPVTDMAIWDTNKFFNNVADVLLSSLNLTITNIPIFPTNYYGVATHRMLQMAANIYDATSSNQFPSVFRPIISSNPPPAKEEYWISGYYYDDNAANVTNFLLYSHGVPMVIGAKKCIPNFNEYSAQTAIMAARKLEMRRADTNSPPYQTNEMFIIGISNFFGLEAWNSCIQTNQGPFDMLVANNISMTLTNSEGFSIRRSDRFSTLKTLTTWEGFAYPNYPERYDSRLSFKVPLYTNNITLPNAIYRPPPSPFLENIAATNFFTPNSGFRTPTWHLSISNNLVYVLSITNRILDFVHFPNLTNHINLGKDLMGNTRQIPGEGIIARCWETNRSGASPTIFSPTIGIQAQIDISLGNPTVSQTHWKQFSFDTQDKDAGIDGFRQFVGLSKLNPVSADNTNLIQQAPFTPARKMVVTARWEVNDPLVHYLEEHLKDITNNYSLEFVTPFTGEMTTNQSLGHINRRYAPWRGPPQGSPQPEDTDPTLKDPGVAKSDDWDFPTNKFPSIGWLGRVHRGTPWQTIYLKAGAAPAKVWEKFSLDPLSHPTNDWRLLDVFTVAIHPNASHGQLSINQTNFAAWSAVLSGVVALSNLAATADINLKTTESYLPVVIEPSSPQLIYLYEGIQKARERQPDKTFRRLGDLLSAPELTQGYVIGTDPASPFLDQSGTEVPYPAYGINDTALERIPQQILSLLKVGDPRYVIYAYGQSLRPAENSILMSGPHVGMCTNYQITGEFATRTVFQIEGTAGNPRPVVKSYNILSAD